MSVERRRGFCAAALALLLLPAGACSGAQPPAKDAEEKPLRFAYPLDDTLRLNQIRMKGTHNSYHIAPDPKQLDEWDYTHLPLDKQLGEQGVRQFELDIHFDSEAERFLVHHLPLDNATTCALFTDCLTVIRTWSDAHRGHHPIFVFIEPKDDVDPQLDKIAGRYDHLEAEILSIWPRERILTPDTVRGEFPTLAGAIQARGWPTLGEVRGMAVFVLLDSDHEPGAHHYNYTGGNVSLDGKLLFATAHADDPYAAILSINSSLHDGDAVAAAVEAGFIVRTMTDDRIEDGVPLSHDRMSAAIGGMAQILSSDFPVPGIIAGYGLSLTDGTPSVCHPTLAPAGCTSADVESPDRLQPLP